MTGYQEVFTDPSYFGQILIETTDHIGNYGVHNEEIESDSIKIAGLVCKKYSYDYSRKTASGSLNDYFIEHNLVGISDVDTRQIVRHIRKNGVMNGIISSEIQDLEVLKAQLREVPDMSGLELSSQVTTEQAYVYGQDNAPFRVAVLDLGVKKNILRCLSERGCFLKVFPAKTTYEEMKAWKADGYMISNGPGDPAAMPYAIETVAKLLEHNEKMFGICLGSQILALASGFKTFKMHNGHRGLNHPVLNIETGLSEITSQNHGFAIDANSGPDGVIKITHINLNDQTVEGLKVIGKPAFAVQYHPESSPGPHDSRYLFDQFIQLLENKA